MLLRHGAQIDKRDENGETALCAALEARSFGCVWVLLDHGASVAGPPERDDRRTPLHAACHTAVIGSSHDDSGKTPAAADCAAVRRLLAAGAEVDAVDGDELTPLMLAARDSRVFAVRALCAYGADVAATRRSCGQTPLHFAVNNTIRRRWLGVQPSRVNKLCVEELIERGADLMAEDREGKTPFHHAHHNLHESRDDPRKARRGRALLAAAAVMLAHWPHDQPLPEGGGDVGVPLEVRTLQAALECARQRLRVLRDGRDDAEKQAQLLAAFLRHARDACGAAVAPGWAPFQLLRFALRGGLERDAWPAQRAMHPFAVERVALARAKLQITSAALAVAAERSVPLLRAAAAAAAAAPASREAEKATYAAVRAVGRWGDIIAVAAALAEREVREALQASGRCLRGNRWQHATATGSSSLE